MHAMLLLRRDDIRAVFSMRDAIEADKEAFVAQTRGETRVPLRGAVDVPGGQSLFMPAYVGGAVDRCGIKIVTVMPHNGARGKPVVPATVALLDRETGEVEALLDGTTLTQMRTAAVSGVATELLAREDARVGALFGTGGQAECQLEALLAVRSLEEVRIFDPLPGRAEAFATRCAPRGERSGARLIPAATPADAVRGADVITTVTTAATPVFRGEDVAPGAHVNAVGSYTPDRRELDTTLMERAGRVFVDHREAVLAEAGDLLIPLAEGRFSLDRIAGDLGELLEGRVVGRTSPEEITVMKTVGFATLDVVAAARVLEKARAAGRGEEVAW